MKSKSEITLQSPISALNGIGATRAAAFERLGVTKIRDLISFYPRSYENRGSIKLLSEAEEGEKQAFMLTVATMPKKVMLRRGMTLLKLRAYDDSGAVNITYFNQDYLKDFFELGQTYRFYGKAEKSGKTISLTNPVAEKAEGRESLLPLVPVYPLAAGLTRKIISQSVHAALRMAALENTEILPDSVIAENGLCSLAFAQRNIHLPPDYKSLAAAKRRLIFDEFFTFAMGTSISSARQKCTGAPVCSENDITPLTKILPFSLTGAQMRAIEDIKNDMGKNFPMCRMVVGDVGCGKTLCAAAAIFIAVQSGRQAMLMAPTGILALQHYNEIKNYADALGFSCRLLTGATSLREKQKIYDGISSSDPQTRIDVVIGTHALLNEQVKLSSLGLVVTDEQHRFGVGQRARLAEKGEHIHTLVMSATPIPRSLALTLYGDLDISIIDEMPPGRQKVDTFVVDESYRERLLAFIDKQIAEGGRVYVVCPEVSEREEDEEDGDVFLRDVYCCVGDDGSFLKPQKNENGQPKAVVTYAEELRACFPHLNVGLVHGRMKPAEKDEVMSAFASGEIQVLVSTTVIEVGVNVPEASLMIIENADRFGLAQLHQLRGRVGRGRRKSYCVLVSGSKGEAAKERLSTMKATSNGFEIAEKDLQTRGPGDFIRPAGENGLRQSGTLRFALADMCEDSEILVSAAAAARELLDGDPDLSKPEHAALRLSVGRMFSDNSSIIS